MTALASCCQSSSFRSAIGNPSGPVAEALFVLSRARTMTPMEKSASKTVPTHPMLPTSKCAVLVLAGGFAAADDTDEAERPADKGEDVDDDVPESVEEDVPVDDEDDSAVSPSKSSR